MGVLIDLSKDSLLDMIGHNFVSKFYIGQNEIKSLLSPISTCQPEVSFSSQLTSQVIVYMPSSERQHIEAWAEHLRECIIHHM